jgi:hypothetical protein
MPPAGWFQQVEYLAARVADGEFPYEDAPLLRSCLPPVLAERYDAPFLAHFARVAGDLSTRVETQPARPSPSCMAEELALVAIADYAEIVAEDELPAGVGEFDGEEEYIEYTMQDDDVRLLWTRFGRRAIVGEVLDYANLDFASWFKPFGNAIHSVAPAPSPSEMARWIAVNSYESESGDA